ncbi:aspartyl-phosphate phosphatase Spo0E family protein [Virgibacillus senegalensis]|uniref:aspartyl-phosphate phosphatase Spo0E family protein n=1 Tax=Virgibacillus senegalensis TaxID=1499679 RepID=UPI000B1BC7F5|nr:aspartyl-phosphate phosphatase Spo0E family protein [Virgibacillus senegalensis]
MLKGKIAGRDFYHLQERIAEKRGQMIQAANKNGLSSLITLKISQELDGLLNQYAKDGQTIKNRNVKKEEAVTPRKAI